MTPQQAIQLYGELFNGEAIGSTSDGDEIQKQTPLAAILQFIGARRIYWRGNWKPEDIRREHSQASAFLRQWADQIDKAGQEATAKA